MLESRGRRSRAWPAILLACSLLTPVLGHASAASAALPVVSVGSASVLEGDSSTRTMYVPVTLSPSSETTVTVDYLVVGGTASTNVDFKARSGRLKFGAGSTIKLIPIAVYGDTVAERNETLTVRLWNATAAALGTSVASSTIINDDSSAEVRVGVGDVRVYRSFAGTSATIRAMVTLSRPSASTVSVPFRITSTTAAAGIDYSPPSSTVLSFSSGTVSKYIGFRIYARDVTSTSGIAITLSSPVGAKIARGTGLVTLAPAPPAAPVPPPSIYWGAWIGKQFTGTQVPWDMTAMSKFATLAGKAPSLVNFSSPFLSATWCNGYCVFQPTLFDKVRNHGAIPFFSWNSAPGTGAFTDAKIATGAQDTYITAWATAARKWGHPLFLRFDWEMNGSWMPWGVGANGNTAADYVAMWRHVHERFANAGAKNVTWVWCPNIDQQNKFAPLAQLYPGDSYVDWTCLDGYNWGTNPEGNLGGWQSFDFIYHSTYHTIVDTIAPTKPMIIGEMASTEYGGSKAAWIADALNTQLAGNYPKIRGFLWFEKGGSEAGNMDWPMESSTLSRAAFANGVASSPFARNSFATLATSPIPPP